MTVFWGFVGHAFISWSLVFLSLCNEGPLSTVQNVHLAVLLSSFVPLLFGDLPYWVVIHLDEASAISGSLSMLLTCASYAWVYDAVELSWWHFLMRFATAVLGTFAAAASTYRPVLPAWGRAEAPRF